MVCFKKNPIRSKEVQAAFAVLMFFALFFGSTRPTRAAQFLLLCSILLITMFSETP